MCYQLWHDFQLKMHHKTFVGRSPAQSTGELTAYSPDPLAGFRGRGSGGEGKGREGTSNKQIVVAVAQLLLYEINAAFTPAQLVARNTQLVARNKHHVARSCAGVNAA